MTPANPNDIYGVIIYPHAYWSTLTPRSGRIQPPPQGTPAQMQLPQKILGSLMYSGNQSPDSMSYHKASSKLFTPEHTAFTGLADYAAKHYLDLDHNQGHYEHLHGIGTWMDTAEPAIATVFKRPLSAQTLANIGAHVGNESRQQSVLAFSAHPQGPDRLLHMRLSTHKPHFDVDTKTLGHIADTIGREMTAHARQTDDGMTPYLPAFTILPDRTGQTDVLAAVHGKELDAHTKMRIFEKISHRLRARSVQYYPGTSVLLGLPHVAIPDDSDHPDESTDEGKRLAALIRYKKIITGKYAVLPRPHIVGRLRMALLPHASGTGTIVRGINYPPGQFIPPVVDSVTPATPQPTTAGVSGLPPVSVSPQAPPMPRQPSYTRGAPSPGSLRRYLMARGRTSATK